MDDQKRRYSAEIVEEILEGVDALNPIVEVTVRGRDLIIRECPHCGQRHLHGASGYGPVHGHRTPHCPSIIFRRGKVVNLPPRPFGAGYFLVERPF